MANRPFPVVFFDLGETLVTSSRAWIPGAPKALAQLHRAGVRLGIISNTDGLDRQALLALLPVDFNLGLFDEHLVLLSSEVGHKKPELTIFRMAVKRAGVAPIPCLFCTDDLLEALAVQQTGMRAARVTTPGDIKHLSRTLEDLASLGS